MIEPVQDAPLTLGYMTSLYARASDFFIRGEVAQLRAFGHTVHTFSVRRSDASEAVSEDVARERAATTCLVEAGVFKLVPAWIRMSFRSPKRMLEAARIALKISRPGLKGRIWPWIYLVEASYLAELLIEKKVQHLHNHIAETSASIAMLASVLSGVPFSMTVHGPNEFDNPKAFAYDEKIHRAAFTAAITEFGRSQLYRWCDYADWSKVKVIHSGVARKFLDHELTPVPEVPRFICIGRLAEQKGQLLLVEAAGLLAAEGHDFEVVLIGDGPMRAPIEGLIEKFELADRVKIAGWMSSDAVHGEILKSRALVLPSFAEGLPMVIMESLALGRPVISTFVAGIPELVEPGVCGWLVPAGSIQPLVDAMRTVLTTSPEELSRMGRAGAVRVAEQHDGAKEMAKMVALFRQSIGESVRQIYSSTSTARPLEGRDALVEKTLGVSA